MLNVYNGILLMVSILSRHKYIHIKITYSKLFNTCMDHMTGARTPLLHIGLGLCMSWQKGVCATLRIVALIKLLVYSHYK